MENGREDPAEVLFKLSAALARAACPGRPVKTGGCKRILWLTV